MILCGGLDCFAYFINIAHSICVQNNLVTPDKLVQVDERTGVAIGVIDMGCDAGVAIPGWESSTFQIACLIAKPGNILPV